MSLPAPARARPPRPLAHPHPRLDGGRARRRPRPGRRAEGESGAAAAARGPHARSSLPEALDPDARVARGRGRPPRRDRALPPGRAAPAGARRVDRGHGACARALPRRARDPHSRARGGGDVRRSRRHPGRQRAHRRGASAAGARRPADDPRALRHARGRARRVGGGRQQRLRLARRGLCAPRRRAHLRRPGRRRAVRPLDRRRARPARGRRRARRCSSPTSG